MGYEKITIYIMVAATVVLISWDVFVAFFNQEPNEKDTISGIMKSAGRECAFLPYGWGVLMGHFWVWVVPEPWIPQPWAALSLVGIGGIVTGAHFFIKKRIGRFVYLPPILYLAIGIILGSGLWPQ